MAEALRFTVDFTDGGDGWVMAQVEEVPGAISQGRTREEARENVVDALHLMLKPEPGGSMDHDLEPFDLPLPLEWPDSRAGARSMRS
jgi:predicted RNase H-like HicB family nuclease